MKIGQRIAYQQAKIILFSSFLIGGCSALVQFYMDLNHVRDSLRANVDRSIELYVPNLERAIYNLDSIQTQTIANSLINDPLFYDVQIYDDFGEKIASASVEKQRSRSLQLDEYSFDLIGLPETFEQTITIQSSEKANGLLVLKLDKQYVANGLTNRAVTLAVSGLIATFALSTILFLIFYYVLSKPIQQVSRWVAELDKDHRGLVPPYKKQDELGELVQNVAQIWHKKDQASQQVATLAYFDPLTDLANRRRFVEQLDKMVDSGIKQRQIGAVMYLDIDRFKTINDSLGHQVGDQLLMTLAQRLKGVVLDTAIVARFGGDEFVIMLPELSGHVDEAAEKAMSIASEIANVIAVPVQIGRNLIHCSASIGLTTFPQQDDSSSQVLRRADTAMYRIKAEGRNGYRFFDVTMQQEAQKRWQLEEGLHKAIERNQLEVWIQPQVSNEYIITGAEVLLRWRHPEKGMISPMDFISVAEESGQISAIEEWVLEESLNLLSRWQATGMPSTFRHLSINISPSHFMQADFIQRMLPILEKHPVPDINIEFEITENLLINNFKQAIETMQALQEKGISFSIDDFGTGYSSLRYLNQLPINVLKIDRSFVSDITKLDDNAPIVDVILLMAKKLNLEVIAEGVETQIQHQFLAQRECSLYQGYYFSKPMHHRDFFNLLTQNDGVINPPSDYV
ncbi:putative bifunctional diguanylate cyclase/phosphodiesterase [Marinomonas atlantica]|uniref:putative bifunctional diguanylate cyclase/phosphodiesterase n=1 Tax=Marinomonas atlantica TaxID=1806668 RepID=UPI0008359B9A|nr:GGDEF domain-containing phosphodiesterase [Marinomonas atlantica]